MSEEKALSTICDWVRAGCRIESVRQAFLHRRTGHPRSSAEQRLVSSHYPPQRRSAADHLDSLRRKAPLRDPSFDEMDSPIAYLYDACVRVAKQYEDRRDLDGARLVFIQAAIYHMCRQIDPSCNRDKFTGQRMNKTLRNAFTNLRTNSTSRSLSRSPAVVLASARTSLRHTRGSHNGIVLCVWRDLSAEGGAEMSQWHFLVSGEQSRETQQSSQWAISLDFEVSVEHKSRRAGVHRQTQLVSYEFQTRKASLYSSCSAFGFSILVIEIKKEEKIRKETLSFGKTLLGKKSRRKSFSTRISR